MKHTPGKWELGVVPNTIASCVNGEEFIIAKMGVQPEMEANARLIAAAPELLEVLKRIIKNAKGPACIGIKEYQDMITAGEAAIAEAEGGKAL
jgi:hypothetical protein